MRKQFPRGHSRNVWRPCSLEPWSAATLVCSALSSSVTAQVRPRPLTVSPTCLFSLSPHVGLAYIMVCISSPPSTPMLFLPFPPSIPESPAPTSAQLLWLMLQALHLPGFLTGLSPAGGGPRAPGCGPGTLTLSACMLMGWL